MKYLGIKGLKLLSECALALFVMYYSLKGNLEVAITAVSVLIGINIVDKVWKYMEELDNWYESKYGDNYAS